MKKDFNKMLSGIIEKYNEPTDGVQTISSEDWYTLVEIITNTKK